MSSGTLAVDFDVVARTLRDAAAELASDDDLQHEGQRALFNALTVTVGAARRNAAGRLLALAGARRGTTPAAPGIDVRVTPATAALVTGYLAHVDDFDDTHLATVIHPSAATLGAVWAAGHPRSLSVGDALRAFTLGCEAQLRLGLAVSPEHYERGFHITGTCGTFGAAVATALIDDADDDERATRMRLALLESTGLRESFGTDLKALHAGFAALAGLDVTSHLAVGHDPSVTLQQFLSAFAGGGHPEAFARAQGDWAMRELTYKPYPCGIVAHPGIDSGLDVHASELRPDAIATIEYRCHPLVVDLMGIDQPKSALQRRFSSKHAVSVAIVEGRAGVPQFDAKPDPATGDLANRIRLAPDPTMPRDAAELVVETATGDTLEFRTPHARGSAARPMTDLDLIDKALVNTQLQQRTVMAMWDLLDDRRRSNQPFVESVQELLCP